MSSSMAMVVMVVVVIVIMVVMVVVAVIMILAFGTLSFQKKNVTGAVKTYLCVFMSGRGYNTRILTVNEERRILRQQHLQLPLSTWEVMERLLISLKH
jgi:uncharacterized membrane protein YdjX (TVP38/TMEM64 family)